MLLLLLLLHGLLLTFTKFTLWPEMVVYPYLVNHGYELYKDLINPYPPYLTLALAAFTRVWGYNPVSFRILTLAVAFFIDLLIFALSKKIYKNNKKALLNTFIFVIISIPLGINGLWFELIQTPFILLSVYFLLFQKQKKSFLISSILLAVAIGIKQQAVWLVPLFLLFKLKRPLLTTANIKSATTLLLPIFILYAATLVLVSAISDPQSFYRWTIILPFFKASSMPGYVLLPSARQLLTVASILLFVLPFNQHAAGNIKKLNLVAIYLIVFAYPRFDYFHLVPATALFCLTFSAIHFKNKKLPLVAAILLLPFIAFSFRYFQGNTGFSTRFFENDIRDASKNLSLFTRTGDKVYIQNGPDQLLALSGLLPPKPWADEFPWYLQFDQTQQKVVDAIKLEKPKYVIYEPYQEGPVYSLGSYKPELIFNYINQNYEPYSKISNSLWLKKLRTSY
ncbi:hypothetical protein HY024_04620 [Candidatus Curtissbacteria bacterium]|nr:hypothetical protein [Candidatus Curtissbacteria bacterium]